MTRRRTASPLMSVLTMPGPHSPWVSEDGAFRIVPNPRLGLPLAPFAVLVSELEPPMHEVSRWRLIGDARGGDVDGVAWLVLRVMSPEEIAPPLVDVMLHNIDGPVDVAVVRSIGDHGVGLFTRSEAPFRLTAPGITVIRIRGRCTVTSVMIVDTQLDIHADHRRLLSLPVDATWPSYHGDGNGRAAAIDRIRAGAPESPAPHEADPGLAAADREEQRINELVTPWLAPALDDLLQLPIHKRQQTVPIADIRGTPRPDNASIDTLGAIYAAATDPGIGRWLGLVDAIGSHAGTALLTVGGVWAVTRDNELFDPIRLTERVEEFTALFGGDPLNEAVIRDIEALDDSMVVLWGWTQAWVDFACPPDLPPQPALRAGAPGRWTAGVTSADDTASVPVEATLVAPLGSLGVIPAAGTTPVQPPLESMPELVRPLLAHEGTAFVSTFANPYAANDYNVFQSDAFGRWSESATPLSVKCPDRPALPKPEPIVSVQRAMPAGTDPWVPRLRVELLVPFRTPGQLEVRTVTVGNSAAKPATSGALMVFEIDGPPLAVGTEVTAEIIATFWSAPGVEAVSIARVPIHDPRPPAPPPPDPVLHFAGRSDASGVAAAEVPLPPAPATVAGFFVERSTETEFARISGLHPKEGATRDARARFWLEHAASVSEAFHRPYSAPVPVTSGSIVEILPGDLRDLVAFRFVPVGTNGASADPNACPFTLYAVPRATEPPPPVLSIDRSGASPQLTVRRRRGGVVADRYRIRMLSADDDIRTAAVIATGDFAADDVARVPIPPLADFARVRFAAEVRGEAEAGVPAMPGRWSRPSTPLAHLAVPAGPPSFVTNAARDGTAIVLTSDPASSPASGSGYQVVIYRSDSDLMAMVTFHGPVPHGARIDTGIPLPPDDLVVVVIDPLGRRSDPVSVS